MLAPGQASHNNDVVRSSIHGDERINAENSVNSHSRVRTRGCAAAAGAVCVSISSMAQTQTAPPVDPQQAAAQGYIQQPVVQQNEAPAFGFKQLFAGTIAAVIQGVGAGVSGALTQGVNGAITNWFGKKLGGGNPAFAAQPAFATPLPTNPYGYPAAPAQDPYAVQQALPVQDPYAAQNAPAAQYPPVASGGQDPYATQTAAPPQDPYAAQAQYSNPPAAGANPYPAPADPYAQQASAGATPSGFAADPAALYAGIAYEVHALGAGGSSTPVDSNTYTFATGERFVVYYRPTLPGRVTIRNVNPLGQEKQIDAVDVAAGQLVTLGPYEFRDIKGDEILRLHLSPCQTDALLLATRDIVKVGGTPAGDGLNLRNCAVASRGVEVRTRDIAKVGVEGSTSFAFDPVQQQEVATGQFAARELTIVLRHR